MEKETKHTPERWEAKLIFRTNLDKVGVWVVTDITDGTRLFMKLNTPRAEHHAKLIASAPTIKAELEEYKTWNSITNTTIKSVQKDNDRLQTELSEMKKQKNDLEDVLGYTKEAHQGQLERMAKDFIEQEKQLSEMKKEREELIEKKVDKKLKEYIYDIQERQSEKQKDLKGMIDDLLDSKIDQNIAFQKVVEFKAKWL